MLVTQQRSWCYHAQLADHAFSRHIATYCNFYTLGVAEVSVPIKIKHSP
jgi:hypothetical protein